MLTILLSTSLAGAAPRRLVSQGERAGLHAKYERMMDKFEWYNRGAELQKLNYGARGRINATNDEAQKAETPYLPPLTERWF